MTKYTRRPNAGFTLIELLTVIAIIGILAAIIIPTVGNVQKRAQRTTDGSNLRQIGQAALIYAQDNKDRLPSISISSSATTFGRTSGTANTTNVHLFAAALAVGAGLNDARFWVSKIDESLPNGDDAPNASLSTVINGTKDAFTTGFIDCYPSLAVVGGLSSSDPATSPVAFTRGLNTNGSWEDTHGVYKKEGGYIYFLGGNVAFFKSVGTVDGSNGDGELVGTNGNKTINILSTIKASRRVYAKGNVSNTAAETGLAGIGP